MQTDAEKGKHAPNRHNIEPNRNGIKSNEIYFANLEFILQDCIWYIRRAYASRHFFLVRWAKEKKEQIFKVAEMSNGVSVK